MNDNKDNIQVDPDEFNFNDSNHIDSNEIDQNHIDYDNIVVDPKEFETDYILKNETKKKKPFLKELRSWIFSFVFAMIIAQLLVTYVCYFIVVIGTSMQTTLNESDYLFAEQISYKFGEPQRGDIVICHYPDGGEDNFIKRVIATGGETIEIFNNVVYINGEPDIDLWQYGHKYYDYPKSTVPENSYFVMGDNRQFSKDSRSEVVGFIPKQDIKAKAQFRIFPLNQFGSLY